MIFHVKSQHTKAVTIKCWISLAFFPLTLSLSFNFHQNTFNFYLQNNISIAFRSTWWKFTKLFCCYWVRKWCTLCWRERNWNKNWCWQIYWKKYINNKVSRGRMNDVSFLEKSWRNKIVSAILQTQSFFKRTQKMLFKAVYEFLFFFLCYVSSC